MQWSTCHCFVLCVAPFCGFVLHFSAVALAETGKHPGSSPHATPNLVDYHSLFQLSLNLENVCTLGIFSFMATVLSLLSFSETFPILICHF